MIATVGYIEIGEYIDLLDEEATTFVVDSLSQLPFWSQLNYVGGSAFDGETQRFETKQDVITTLRNRNHSIIGLGVDKTNEVEPIITIIASKRAGNIKVTMASFPDFLKAYQNTLIQDIKECFIKIVQFFLERGCYTDSGIGIGSRLVKRKRPKRPIGDPLWGAYYAIDIFVEAFLDKDLAPYQQKNYEKFKILPLPTIAKRTYQDGVLLVEWCDDLFDEEKMSNALAVREQWLVDNLEIQDFDFRFNENGDCWHNGISLSNKIVNDPDITLYSPTDHVAYKSAVLDQVTQQLDQDVIALIEDWKQYKQSRVGTAIASICLLLPDRVSALHVSENYSNLVDAVVFINNDNKIWEVNPSTVMAG